MLSRVGAVEIVGLIVLGGGEVVKTDVVFVVVTWYNVVCCGVEPGVERVTHSWTVGPNVSWTVLRSGKFPSPQLLEKSSRSRDQTIAPPKKLFTMNSACNYKSIGCKW